MISTAEFAMFLLFIFYCFGVGSVYFFMKFLIRQLTSKFLMVSCSFFLEVLITNGTFNQTRKHRLYIRFVGFPSYSVRPEIKLHGRTFDTDIKF